MTHFGDRLTEANRRTATPLCMGIDPHISMIPAIFGDAQDGAASDAAIRAIHPYRYSYKPKFGQDRYNAIAVASVGINGMLSAAFLGYSSIVEDKEQRRILGVEQQIAMLQQVKAEKHCFE